MSNEDGLGERTEVVRTRSGPVVGLSEDGLAVFRGIPYAAAPFGERRFLGPLPHEPWSEPLEAFSFGPTSPQKEHAAPGGLPDVPEPIIHGDEILNLNVWTPALSGPEPLPVLVWIHGGGFFAGCSANPWYDGASFAHRGIVVVSINYRLGAEGFLEIQGATPNRALRDWLSALEWVRDNVGAFGGDRSRVTVMGQSAGGLAVSALLATNASSGLFRQAIIASGVSDHGIVAASQAHELARMMAAAVGAEPTRDELMRHDPASLVDAHLALMAAADRSGEGVSLFWAPVLDGDLLSASLLEAVRDGRTSEIPVLVGTTKNEFAWRSLRGQPDSEVAYREGQELFADALFRRPTEVFAQLRVSENSSPTYRYEFQWKSTAAPYILAGHSLDIPFFFNNLAAAYVDPYTGANPPQELATFEHEAFASFVRTGDPGWPQFADGASVMIFDLEPRVVSGLGF
jgi:para-nitrobenzyl esterase